MIDPNAVEDEELCQQSLREWERDRRQVILDAYVERMRAVEAEDRRFWREMRRSLDPYKWGRWGPWESGAIGFYAADLRKSVLKIDLIH
jgi:hypothetical protein